MKKLFVYADFDWLDNPQLIGELSCDSVRGSETYGFSYDKEWLVKYGDVFLSEDWQNYTGIQYTRPERDIFACFSDALPDRWGRTLLNRREQIAATDEKRAVRRLTSFDYLMGIDDASRMGGFRFAETPREYPISIRRRIYAFIRQSREHNHRGKNSHEIMALGKPADSDFPSATSICLHHDSIMD